MIRFSDLRKRVVVGAHGKPFGELDDLVVERDGWKILSLALGLQKPFWRRARIAIPALHLREENDVIVLDMSRDQFAELMDGDTIEIDVY